MKRRAVRLNDPLPGDSILEALQSAAEAESAVENMLFELDALESVDLPALDLQRLPVSPRPVFRPACPANLLHQLPLRELRFRRTDLPRRNRFPGGVRRLPRRGRGL